MKANKQTFIIEFPIITTKFQEDILAKRLELGRQVYNRLVKHYSKMWSELTRTKQYRNIKEELKKLKKDEKIVSSKGNEQNKEHSQRKSGLYKELNAMYKVYGFTEHEMQKQALKISKPYIKHLDPDTSENIGKKLWRAWEEYLYKNGDAIHCSKTETFNTIEGKNNKAGIIFKENVSAPHLWKGKRPAIIWNDLLCEVKINYKNHYEADVLKKEIAHNRIIRRFIKGKERYFLQIVFKGLPPFKVEPETGKIKNPLGKGPVGINIKPQLIAAVSKEIVFFDALTHKIQDIQSEIATIQKAMDRSKRAMNPNNYNADGTIKMPKNKKLTWIKSNKYIKMENQLKSLNCKQETLRRLQHHLTVNSLLEMGDVFYIETDDYKKIQMTHLADEITMADTEPAMLVDILIKKVEQRGGTVIKVNTDKKNADIKWGTASDCQAHLYSAFLLMNIDERTGTVDQTKCQRTFPAFKDLHDEIIDIMENDDIKYPECMGINK